MKKFTMITALIAVCLTVWMPIGRAAETQPTYQEPDKTVTLPAALKKDAEACYASGYKFFIWPTNAGPFRRSGDIILTVPINYIAKDKPEPYRIAFTILAEKEGSNQLAGNRQVLTSRKYTYSSAGKTDAFHLDAFKQFTSGKASAKICLVDLSGQKQISNELTVDVEL